MFSALVQRDVRIAEIVRALAIPEHRLVDRGIERIDALDTLDRETQLQRSLVERRFCGELVYGVRIGFVVHEFHICDDILVVPFFDPMVDDGVRCIEHPAELQRHRGREGIGLDRLCEFLQSERHPEFHDELFVTDRDVSGLRALFDIETRIFDGFRIETFIHAHVDLLCEHSLHLLPGYHAIDAAVLAVLAEVRIELPIIDSVAELEILRQVLSDIIKGSPGHGFETARDVVRERLLVRHLFRERLDILILIVLLRETEDEECDDTEQQNDPDHDEDCDLPSFHCWIFYRKWLIKLFAERFIYNFLQNFVTMRKKWLVALFLSLLMIMVPVCFAEEASEETTDDTGGQVDSDPGAGTSPDDYIDDVDTEENTDDTGGLVDSDPGAETSPDDYIDDVNTEEPTDEYPEPMNQSSEDDDDKGKKKKNLLMLAGAALGGLGLILLISSLLNKSDKEKLEAEQEKHDETQRECRQQIEASIGELNGVHHRGTAKGDYPTEMFNIGRGIDQIISSLRSIQEKCSDLGIEAPISDLTTAKETLNQAKTELTEKEEARSTLLRQIRQTGRSKQNVVDKAAIELTNARIAMDAAVKDPSLMSDDAFSTDTWKPYMKAVQAYFAATKTAFAYAQAYELTTTRSSAGVGEIPTGSFVEPELSTDKQPIGTKINEALPDGLDNVHKHIEDSTLPKMKASLQKMNDASTKLNAIQSSPGLCSVNGVGILAREGLLTQQKVALQSLIQGITGLQDKIVQGNAQRLKQAKAIDDARNKAYRDVEDYRKKQSNRIAAAKSRMQDSGIKDYDRLVQLIEMSAGYDGRYTAPNGEDNWHWPIINLLEILAENKGKDAAGSVAED